MTHSNSNKPQLASGTQHRADCIADFQRVVEWAKSKNRKPANLAFTAGPERQAAYWIEWAEINMPNPTGQTVPHEAARKD